MKRIDRTGIRYGRLTVIGLDRIENGCTFWKCRCDCGNITIVSGCKLHGGHTKSCGCLRLENNRKQRKENEYEIIDGYAKVKLNDTDYMLCDIDDWEKLKKHHWYVNSVGYATAGTLKDGSFLFHKKVTNTKKEIVDHINMNKLDNRKCNLRIANKQINSINSELPSNNTTGHKGVYHDKRYDTWHTRITVSGKTILLGTYKTKEEAITVRKLAEEKYYTPLLEEAVPYALSNVL